jgi:hypothetical protein
VLVGNGPRAGAPSDPQDVFYYLWRYRDETVPLWIDLIRALSWTSTRAAPPARKGRRRGPTWARTPAEFERRIQEKVRLLEKHSPERARQEDVAKALGMSRKTMTTYCKFFGLSYWEIVQRAREEA